MKRDFEHTLEDLAELLDGQQTAALYFTAIILEAAEPAPEQSTLTLLSCQLRRHGSWVPGGLYRALHLTTPHVVELVVRHL